MTSKTYSKKFDPQELAKSVEQWFSNSKFETQIQSSEDCHMVQAKKSSLMRSALGGSRAFTVIIKNDAAGTTIETTTGEWAQNLSAVGIGTLLTGGLSLVGSGMAAGWTKKIEFDLWQFLDNKVFYAESSTNTERECPFCAESIKRKAKICRFCKSEVTPIYVEHSGANKQIAKILDLVEQGKSYESVADQLKSSKEFRLDNGEPWTAEEIEKIANDFGSIKPKNPANEITKNTTSTEPKHIDP